MALAQGVSLVTAAWRDPQWESESSPDGPCEYPDAAALEAAAGLALLHMHVPDEPALTVEAWGLRIDQPLPNPADELELRLTDIVAGAAVVKTVYTAYAPPEPGPGVPDAVTVGRGQALPMPLFASDQITVTVGPDGASWAETIWGEFSLEDVRIYGIGGQELLRVPICVEGASRLTYLGDGAVVLAGWNGQLEAFAIAGGAGAELADAETQSLLYWDDGWTTGRKRPLRLFVAPDEGQAIAVWDGDAVFSLRHDHAAAEKPPIIRHLVDAPVSALGWDGLDWYGAHLAANRSCAEVIHGRGPLLIEHLQFKIKAGSPPAEAEVVRLAPDACLSVSARTVWMSDLGPPGPPPALLAGWQLYQAPDGSRGLVAPDGSVRDITRYATADPLTVAIGSGATRLHALDRRLGLVVLDTATGSVIERRHATRDWRPPAFPSGRWTAQRCSQDVALTLQRKSYRVGIEVSDGHRPDRHWLVGWDGADHVRAVGVTDEGTLVAATARQLVRLPLSDLLH